MSLLVTNLGLLCGVKMRGMQWAITTVTSIANVVQHD